MNILISYHYFNEHLHITEMTITFDEIRRNICDKLNMYSYDNLYWSDILSHIETFLIVEDDEEEE